VRLRLTAFAPSVTIIGDPALGSCRKKGAQLAGSTYQKKDRSHSRLAVPGHAAVMAAAAFALFVVYLLQMKDQAFLRHLVANPLVYDSQARTILEGMPRTQPFFLSPMYPAFVALLYALGGGSRLIVLTAQGVLLAFNVYLIGIGCSRILSRRAAIGAMVVMTLYWSFYYFAGEILPTTLCLTFLLAGWVLFIRRDTPNLHPVAPVSLAFAGLIALVYALPAVRHLGSLVRGSSLPASPGAYWGSLGVFLIFVPACLLLLAAARWSKRLRPHSNLLASGLALGFSMLVWSGTSLVTGLFALSLLLRRSARLARVGAFVLGLAVAVAASMSHNYLISGDLIPVTSSFGVNLFIGNNPASDGMDPFKLGEANKVRIEADRRGLEGAERSAFFSKQAVSFMRTQPGRWLALVGKKTLASASRFNIDNNADISERRDAWKWLFLPMLHFGIVFPLGIAGIRYCLREDRRGDTLVLGFAGSMAVGIIFFAAERFRLPATAFLIPLAVCGVLGLYGDITARRWRSLVIVILMVTGGAALSNIDFLGLTHVEFPSIIINKAHVRRLEGDLEGARELAEVALKKEPGNAGAYFQLGVIEETQGNQAAALSLYLDCLAQDPFFYASYSHSKKILESVGITPSYIDIYVAAVLDGKPLEDLHRNLVRYVTTRTRD
jgi:tetratricopeptide (TPR) repeat protein